jgi:hypothetical protein
MDESPSCGNPIEPSWGPGRPRRWCATCLPSFNVVGTAEYQRRHKLLRGGQRVTGSPRPFRICSVPGCGRAVDGHGLCATDLARAKA